MIKWEKNMDFKELREKYPEFIYKSYDIDETETEINVRYHFEITGLCDFNPSWIFTKNNDGKFSDNPTFLKSVFALGMVELISYWKSACPPIVKVLAGDLSEKQALWFKKLYFKGLGEFFYRNGIETDIVSFMNILPLGEKIEGTGEKISGEKNLISIGGGKDSIVSLELLSPFKNDNFCYIINPNEATKASAKMGGYKDKGIIPAKRTLDRKIVELNSQGFLNGHTPFSAIVAFSSLITAYINGIRYIVLSNESSANESTVMGTDVNHQYSKSFEFEEDFRAYQMEFIDSGCEYFSLLRPLTEFQIAKYFSEKSEYHSVFKSCNLGSKTDCWCCDCPKCLFITIILSPFLSPSDIEEIFGENLLTKEKMIPTFDKLLGLTPEKPFECVGSRAEVVLAVNLTAEKYKKANKPLPCLLAHYAETCGVRDVGEEYRKFLSHYDEQNNLPEKFEKILREEFGLRKD